MATAVHLAAPPVIDPEKVALLGLGPFGHRVAGLLARMTGGTELARDGTPETAFAGAPSTVVLAMWRPAPALCERADALAHVTGIPWLPIVLEPLFVQVGPLVVPGAGPCYRCFDERRMQHDRQGPQTAALYAAYDRDPACGPAGFLPQHARLAAGLAATTLLRPDGMAGQVISAALNGVSFRQDPVIGCHGCPRCGRPLPERDLRTLLRLPRKEATGAR